MNGLEFIVTVLHVIFTHPAVLLGLLGAVIIGSALYVGHQRSAAATAQRALDRTQRRSYLLLDDVAALADIISQRTSPGFRATLVLYRCYSCGASVLVNENESWNDTIALQQDWKQLHIKDRERWLCAKHVREVEALLTTMDNLA